MMDGERVPHADTIQKPRLRRGFRHSGVRGFNPLPGYGGGPPPDLMHLHHHTFVENHVLHEESLDLGPDGHL